MSQKNTAQENLPTISTDQKVTEPSKENLLHGYIERTRAGMLIGWAASKESDKQLNLLVLKDERTIGSGFADIARSDLKEHGINNGQHGFKISLDLDGSLRSGTPLTLVDADSLHPIKHNVFYIKSLEADFSADFFGVEHGHVTLKIWSDKSLGEQTATVIIDGSTELKLHIDTNDNDIELRFLLPVRILDFNNHLFQVIIEGYPVVLATAIFNLKPIITPWQYLNSSYRQPGILKTPKQAGYRYESLEYQLKALTEEASQHTIGQISLLHNVLVQSYEDRKVFPAFSLPAFSDPKVSIIVPAYNKFELTYHCIASIAFAFNTISYEVILADDCSTDETAEAESIISNLIVSRNPENLRFLKSCNQASKLAKGQYIVFLNNDTEVTSHWLDELVSIMEKDKTVGMTGSKLLNLDGSLQEAGGLVWNDGNPWNVGRGENPLAPEYNYVRHVDYLTGAAMCIRADIWQEVGLFSESFAPCYYEDTDLAFKVREAGYSTLYTPFSEVIHFEGQSHGTDVTQGMKRYQVINYKTFGSRWFSAFKNNGNANLENMKLHKDRNIDHRILVIDYATPQADKDAGSYAAIQEIKLLITLGFKVTFVPENLAFFGKHTTALQKMGVEVLYAPFYTSVQDVINKRIAEMDAVYITRYNIAEKCIDQIKKLSKIKIIFNNADLHFLRELRSALKNGRDEKMLQKAINTRDSELSVCQKVDAILCYNTTEHAVISSHILDTEKLHLTPWVLENKTPGLSFEKREGIAFLGGFNHFPNVESVEYLADKIMPLLALQRPDICLYVYGSNMPDKFIEYEAENIKVVGFAAHLDDVYHNHRVFVAPLLSGAGIKGKVLEAMAYNLPCVLTGTAAEGTGLTHGISSLIVQKPEEWVDAIIKLYDDKALWEKFSENEQTIVEVNYSFEHAVQTFKDIFSSVGLYSSK